MIASVIMFLIYVCILALIIYLIIWVLRDVVGVPIPPKVVQILWVIVALICILWLVQMILGAAIPFVSHTSDEPLPPAEPFNPRICKGC